MTTTGTPQTASRAKGRAGVFGLRNEGARNERLSDEGENVGFERPEASGENNAIETARADQAVPAGRPPSATARSPSPCRADLARSSAPTAPARPRCCGCWPASPAPTGGTRRRARRRAAAGSGVPGGDRLPGPGDPAVPAAVRRGPHPGRRAPQPALGRRGRRGRGCATSAIPARPGGRRRCPAGSAPSSALALALAKRPRLPLLDRARSPRSTRWPGGSSSRR